MAKTTVYAETLSRAALAMGGETRLAASLKVPLENLHRWIQGQAHPSTKIYHKTLDLLIGIGTH